MDSEDDMLYEDDSGDEEDLDEDEEFVDIAEPSGTQHRQDDDDFAYEVLTADQIVQHMVDCIKEVNVVVQVCNTVFKK